MNADEHIDVLGLPVRVSNMLKRDHINTIADLTALTGVQLRDITNFGPVAQWEVTTALQRHGLALAESDPPGAALPGGTR